MGDEIQRLTTRLQIAEVNHSAAAEVQLLTFISYQSPPSVATLSPPSVTTLSSPSPPWPLLLLSKSDCVFMRLSCLFLNPQRAQQLRDENVRLTQSKTAMRENFIALLQQVPPPLPPCCQLLVMWSPLTPAIVCLDATHCSAARSAVSGRDRDGERQWLEAQGHVVRHRYDPTDRDGHSWEELQLMETNPPNMLVISTSWNSQAGLIIHIRERLSSQTKQCGIILSSPLYSLYTVRYRPELRIQVFLSVAMVTLRKCFVSHLLFDVVMSPHVSHIFWELSPFMSHDSDPLLKISRHHIIV